MILFLFYYGLFLSGLLIGYLIRGVSDPKPKKRLVGFAAHPEWINTKGRPKLVKTQVKVKLAEDVNRGDMLVDEDDIGVVKYKSLKEQKEEKNISKKEEEAAMTETLSKHFNTN